MREPTRNPTFKTNEAQVQIRAETRPRANGTSPRQEASRELKAAESTSLPPKIAMIVLDLFDNFEKRIPTEETLFVKHLIICTDHPAWDTPPQEANGHIGTSHFGIHAFRDEAQIVTGPAAWCHMLAPSSGSDTTES